jgi:hypothetical protein
MPQQGTILRALIASPSDVQQERQTIPEVIAAWNATNSLERAVIIEPVKWESHSLPGLDDRPQGMINKQLVETCDFLIGVFWTRLGTNTGVSVSGTAEEIEEFRKAGKPVLLYFSSISVDPNSIDLGQYSNLKSYKDDLRKAGLLEGYGNLGELRDKLSRHISTTVMKIMSGSDNDTVQKIADKEHQNTKTSFLERLETFSTRFSADWITERSADSDIDDAKEIMRTAAENLINLVTFIPQEISIDTKNNLIKLASDMKSLRQHQIYMDGGVSYREFWEIGDNIVDNLGMLIFNLKSSDSIQ